VKDSPADSNPPDLNQLAERAHAIRKSLPEAGLFAGHQWRISPEPFQLEPELADRIEKLGRIFLRFYRALNLLYRQSVSGAQPVWVAELLDRGKPPELIEWQRHAAFKNEVPRVIRPDLLLTDNGLAVSELDSVPGGIGLTAWLNQAYGALPGGDRVIGGPDGMLRGFERIFGEAKKVYVVVSEEAATYRPEMEWVARHLGERFQVVDSTFTGFAEGDAVYRFFELFDLLNIPGAAAIFSAAAEKRITVTPPPKPIFEEKLSFALLWNRNLHGFWRRELGEGFFEQLLGIVPYTWVIDPTPLPPHAAFPRLDLTDWQQLKGLSQRERELIIKVSGYSEEAWGARGVFLGSDLPASDWSAAVDRAIERAATSPHLLQRFEKPKTIPYRWFDFENDKLVENPGRVRLCPYYFVVGDGDAARAQIGGILATLCAADKKIIHGMRDAVLAPCSAR
jgi:hypothetical protein